MRSSLLLTVLAAQTAKRRLLRIVDWFNQVDATYRSDLRELNELNFARFDAKLEQRMTALDAKWDRRLGEFRAEWKTDLANLEKNVIDRLGNNRADILKWNVVLWITAILAIIGMR